MQKSIIILGKSETDLLMLDKIKAECFILSINNSYEFYNLKPNAVIFQDRLPLIKDCLYISTDVIKNNQLEPKENWQSFKRTLQPTDLKNELCFYPYSGVAGLHWAIRQSFKTIYIFGFSLKTNHNYSNGDIYSRENYTLKCYKSNISMLLVKAARLGIKIIWISPKLRD